MSAPRELPELPSRDNNRPRASSTSSNRLEQSEEIERAVRRAALLTSGGYRGTRLERTATGGFVRTRSVTVSSGSDLQPVAPQQSLPRIRGARAFSRPPLPVVLYPTPSSSSVARRSEQRRASFSSRRATSPYAADQEGLITSPDADLLQTYNRRLPLRRNSDYKVTYSSQDPPPSSSPPATPRLNFSRPATPVSTLLTEFPLLGLNVSVAPVPPTSPVDPGTPRVSRARSMSYQNYFDSSQGTPGSSPRQAPPSPSQNMNQANGINGGMAMNGGGMVGHPTPAGHQSDLNYVYAMVEELSSQLAINREVTDRITEHMGKIRARALGMDLTNDELIAAAAEELNESSKNLEKENSELRKALERAEYDSKENMKLAIYGANILADIKDKMHKYKEQHERDTLTWHKSYRKQLADEREENLNLRNEINDKIAAAVRANGHLRDLRRHLTDHDELHELRVQNIALRQEKRLWKRMAMPLVPDDSSEWSDDDDLIDPEEKKRLAEKAAKDKAEKETAAANEQGPSLTAA